MAVSPARLKVVEEHAGEAAFLWTQRDLAVKLPQYDLFSLARLDNRIEAHLDGLRIAREMGWERAWAAAEANPRPGEIFTAAVPAFERNDPRKIEAVLAMAAAMPSLGRAVVSALGWIPLVKSGPLIQTLLASETTVFQAMGLGSTAAHRKNPGVETVSKALGRSDPSIKARALRAIGELGMTEMLLALRSNLKSLDPSCRFWAAWSLALLNAHAEAAAHLQAVAEIGGPNAFEAATMAARRLPPRESRAWLIKLVREKNLPRVAIAVAGALGEPEAIPWLLDQCKTPVSARSAAEAFCLITGANLDFDQLAGDKPEGFETGPTDLPDDKEVALDPDEPLGWPNPVRMKAWWDAKKSGFAKETRHLMGRPIAFDSLRAVLKTGYQRQRVAASFELAILKPGKPLLNLRAPGFVQQATYSSPR